MSVTSTSSGRSSESLVASSNPAKPAPRMTTVFIASPFPWGAHSDSPVQAPAARWPVLPMDPGRAESAPDGSGDDAADHEGEHRKPQRDRRTLMELRVVGAGLGRTGTHSLKVAFEQLLGGPCYHMLEVLGRPDQRDTWAAATRGESVDWATFLAPYRATVDWPAATFWREISDAAPHAVVVLSVRGQRCVVEERLGDDLRRPGARSCTGRHRRASGTRDDQHVDRTALHARLARPGRRHRCLRGAQRERPARRCHRTGWWSGVPATDGDPCVPLSAWSSHPNRSRT